MRINGHPKPLHEAIFDREKHRYYVPHRDTPVPSITGIINGMGMGFPSHRMIPEQLAAARARGTYVHRSAELLAADDLDIEAVPEEYAGWIRSLVGAYRTLRLRPLLVEEPMYEAAYDYAGMLDYFGWAPLLVKPPAMALIEWKTGDYQGADMQLGAQAALLRDNYPRLGPVEAFICHLSDNGKWWTERMNDEQGWQDFAAARRLYARLRRQRKEME